MKKDVQSSFKGCILPPKVHWVCIKALKGGMGGDMIEFKRWEDLPWEVRMKWDWYFKYRAALLQVKYPKDYVVFKWGSDDATGVQLGQIVKNKIRSKKAKITEYKNKLKKAEASWNSIFPITDDHLYQKCLKKIARLEQELEDMQNQLQQ